MGSNLATKANIIFLSTFVVLNLAPLSSADKINATKKPVETTRAPLKGHIQKKGKLALHKHISTEMGANNPYAVAHPYNPNNPPPINNKIHPISTNAR